jgi:transcriptional regulator
MTLYVPPHFATADRAAIARLVHDHPFATLLTVAGRPVVTHLPLVLVPDCEPWGTLVVPMPAPIRTPGSPPALSIAVFHGPHAYVSPAGTPTLPPCAILNYAAHPRHRQLAAVPANRRSLA